MGRLRIAFPYILFAGMAVLVLWSNIRGGRPTGVRAQDGEMSASVKTEKQDPNICPPCGMTVSDADDVSAKIDGVVQRFCSEGCRDRYLLNVSNDAPEHPSGVTATGSEGAVSGDRYFDPVCNMEVNPAWGFMHKHDGSAFYFCTKRCREAFAKEPSQFLGTRCLVCDEPVATEIAFPATYMDQTYFLCSEQHRADFKADPASCFLHRMWGIPDWLYYISIALLLIVSYLMFEGRKQVERVWRSSVLAIVPDRVREAARFSTWLDPPGFSDKKLQGAAAALETPGSPSVSFTTAGTLYPLEGTGLQTETGSAPDGERFDLMRFGLVRLILRSRPFRFVAQSVLVFFFVLIVAAGLYGNQNPALNIAPLLTWTIWWCGLVVLIMFAGKAWCYMCPWDAIAGWMEKLRLWKKTDDGFGLNMRWPRAIRNISMAILLFIVLTWVELGFGVTMRPRVTAYLAIAMLLLAIVSAFLFDRKSFCRYGCLVGRISGLYAMFSGIEVRHRDTSVCGSCRGKECISGSGTAYACPTFEHPGRMDVNTYCIQCTECLQSCPHDNLAVNLRPWGSDLAANIKPRSDEAYLALLMLSITGFHGLTMTPMWNTCIDAIQTLVPVGQIVAFTVGMAGLLGFPIVVYTGLVWLSYRLSQGLPASIRQSDPMKNDIRVSFGEYFIRYAYCVLPIALFYHLAHNLEHLLMEGPKIVALMSDPFGWGWNILGTSGLIVPPLVSLDILWLLQVVLVAVGHIYSLWVAQKIGDRVFPNAALRSRGQIPILIGMIAFSIFSLWLLKLPMEMRTSAM